jgi:hypothetical protein
MNYIIDILFVVVIAFCFIHRNDWKRRLESDREYRRELRRHTQ